MYGNSRTRSTGKHAINPGYPDCWLSLSDGQTKRSFPDDPLLSAFWLALPVFAFRRDQE